MPLLRFHSVRHDLCAAVLLPDHAHMLIRPRESAPGRWYDLGKLLKDMKGASARGTNQLLSTRGHVWQDESFDRIVRDAAEFDEKLHYMWMNPVRLGLCTEDETYKFWIVPDDMR
jgi:putative transposase